MSYAAVSECLNHDTVAVHSFQKKFISQLKQKMGRPPSKVYYFSDGSSAQYKNFKNFSNVLYHEVDFGMKAEWHFFATAHGKGPCDGIGGTLKRLASKASLQGNVIETPHELFEFLQGNSPTVVIDYFTEEEYQKEKHELQERFQNSRPIPGTRKFHALRPALTPGYACVERFSGSGTAVEARVICSQNMCEGEMW